MVRDGGGPVRFRHALTRSLVGVAVEWPGLVLPVATWLASLATMMTPRAASGSVTWSRAASSSTSARRHGGGWVPGMPTPLAGWARTLDLTALEDGLALAVRHFLARGHRLVEPARSRLGQSLAAEVAAVTTPPPPPGVPGLAYLAAVLAERHHRAAQRLARARSTTAALRPGLAMPGRSAVALSHRPALPGQLRPAAWDPQTPRPPAPPPGPDWPREDWPTPPWLGPTAEQPDWTGLRPPPLVGALRRPAPPDGPAAESTSPPAPEA